jgi:hypothetical protein
MKFAPQSALWDLYFASRPKRRVEKMFNQTIKSRWFVSVLHAGLWLLLALAVLRLRGTSPHFLETTSHTSPAQTPVPVTRLENLFAPELWPKYGSDTNSPFATRHFIPPPPPPTTTRKVEVTYQGFYQTDPDSKHVFLQVDGALVVTLVGSRIATELFVADATMQALTLTNATAQTNVLAVNTKKVLEVPVK